jgi:hypothetical protein
MGACDFFPVSRLRVRNQRRAGERQEKKIVQKSESTELEFALFPPFAAPCSAADHVTARLHRRCGRPRINLLLLVSADDQFFCHM